MERGQGTLSAVREVEHNFAVPVIAIANLDDLLGFLHENAELRQNMEAINEYRRLYGAVQHV